MDKQLYIALLKENFEYLDFWDECRTPALKAMVTLVQYARKEGKQFPAETLLPHYTLKRADWPENIVVANTILSSFSATLSKFGISFHYGCEFTGWLGLQVLDPKYQELVPESISNLLVYREPAVIQPRTDFDSPTEWPHYFDLADLLPNFEDMLPDIDKDMLPNARMPLPPEKQLKPSQRLLVVDLSRKKDEIRSEFKAFLDKVYDLRTHPDLLSNDSWGKNYTKWSPDTTRAGKPWHQLKIWRMRKERIPFL